MFKFYLASLPILALLILAPYISATPPTPEGQQITNGSITGDMLGKGTVREVKTTALYSDPTIATPSGSAIYPFYHLAEGETLFDATVVVRQAFNDSWLIGSGPFTIENGSNDQIIVATGALPDIVNEGPTLNGGYEESTPFVAGPSGYDLLLNFNGLVHGDGTTGIADVYLLIGTP